MRYNITLTFLLDEPVTPDHLAHRVTEACGKYGALRPGEGVVLPSDPRASLLVSDQPVELPDFLRHPS